MTIFVYRISVGDLSYDYILASSISNFYFVDLRQLECHHSRLNIKFLQLLYTEIRVRTEHQLFDAEFNDF